MLPFLGHRYDVGRFKCRKSFLSCDNAPTIVCFDYSNSKGTLSKTRTNKGRSSKHRRWLGKTDADIGARRTDEPLPKFVPFGSIREVPLSPPECLLANPSEGETTLPEEEKQAVLKFDTRSFLCFLDLGEGSQI